MCLPLIIPLNTSGLCFISIQNNSASYWSVGCSALPCMDWSRHVHSVRNVVKWLSLSLSVSEIQPSVSNSAARYGSLRTNSDAFSRALEDFPSASTTHTHTHPDTQRSCVYATRTQTKDTLWSQSNNTNWCIRCLCINSCNYGELPFLPFTLTCLCVFHFVLWIWQRKHLAQ